MVPLGARFYSFKRMQMKYAEECVLLDLVFYLTVKKFVVPIHFQSTCSSHACMGFFWIKSAKSYFISEFALWELKVNSRVLAQDG